MTEPWLPILPPDWSVQRLGYGCTVSLGKMLDAGRSEGADDVELPYVRAANVQDSGLDLGDVNRMPFSLRETADLSLRRGDLLVVEGGAVGTCQVLDADMPGWSFQKTVNRVRSRGDWSTRFLAYVLRMYRDSGVIDIVCNKSTIPHLTAEKLGQLRIPMPPTDQQRQIAAYLDYETAKLDAIISKQARMIEILRERRTAAADWIVWHGLVDCAESATSIDPAPCAPQHWRRVRNKYLLVERTTVSVDGDEEMLSVSHLTGVTPRSQKNVTMTEAESTIGYRVVQPTDLVINTMWAWMGALGVSRHHGIVSPAYGVYGFRQVDELDVRYFDYLFRSTAYVAQMTRFSRGVWTSRLRLYPDVFLALTIVVPPVDEQRRIADHLDRQVADVDALVSKAEGLIKLANERRKALITAAVTGQIDLRARVA